MLSTHKDKNRPIAKKKNDHNFRRLIHYLLCKQLINPSGRLRLTVEQKLRRVIVSLADRLMLSAEQLQCGQGEGVYTVLPLFSTGVVAGEIPLPKFYFFELLEIFLSENFVQNCKLWDKTLHFGK